MTPLTVKRCATLALGVAAIAWPAITSSQAPPSPATTQTPPATDAKPPKRDLPLETTEKLEFETDEGTWISLDVTPDGTSIVFDLLGDLYRLALAGGAATRITEGQGYDSQPRVSPDGKWIAFVSDRDGNDNLWIATFEGKEPRKLTSEAQDVVISPSWTPDSQYIVASQRSSRGTTLKMFHINGGSGITLGSQPPPAAEGAAEGSAPRGPIRLGASVSPDGRYLFVAQSTTSPRGRFPMWQIGRMDMTTGDVDVITQAEGSAVRPVLSPDGRLLVYATRHETKTGLRVRDLVSGSDRWLLWPVQRDEQESGGAPSRDTFPGYAFVPGGRELVATFDGRIQRVNVETSAVTPVPFTAKVSLDIGPALEFPYRVAQGPVRARLIQDPSVAPDGSRLAFSVLTKLYVKDLPAGQPRRLTTADEWEFKPAWSPDGQWIAYVTWSMQGGHVWKARADGSGQPQRLTQHPAFYTDLAFSPDGTRIVGLRGNEYMRQQTFSEFGGLRIPLDLIWLPSGGGDVTLVVPARGVGAPHFGPEKDRIYVYSDEGLLSLRFDGTDRRTHLKVTGPARNAPRPQPAETVLVRPDGKWALAKVNNQLWVVAVPPYAGQAPTVNVRSPALPAKRLTDIGADYFSWTDGGREIAWAIGSTFYRRAFDTIDFTPEKKGDTSVDAAGTEKAPAKDEEKDKEKTAEPLDIDAHVRAVEIVMEFPRATPTGSVVLRGATVITMNGDEVVRDADVVVTGNRIAGIGRRGRVAIPVGAAVVDIRGTYVVPGFVDTHAHWEFRTHDVLEPQNWSLVANLAYGVTAGLDVQTSTNDYFAYRISSRPGRRSASARS